MHGDLCNSGPPPRPCDEATARAEHRPARPGAGRRARHGPAPNSSPLQAPPLSSPLAMLHGAARPRSPLPALLSLLGARLLHKVSKSAHSPVPFPPSSIPRTMSCLSQAAACRCRPSGRSHRPRPAARTPSRGRRRAALRRLRLHSNATARGVVLLLAAGQGARVLLPPRAPPRAALQHGRQL